jgi:hypothetical protein
VKYAVMEMAALVKAGFTLPRPWEEALAEYAAALPPFQTRGDDGIS